MLCLLAGHGLTEAVRRQLPATRRGHRQRESCCSTANLSGYITSIHTISPWKVQQNRTKGTLDPLVARRVPKSVCTELPGMEDFASGPAASGDHPCQQIPHSPRCSPPNCAAKRQGQSSASPAKLPTLLPQEPAPCAMAEGV